MQSYIGNGPGSTRTPHGSTPELNSLRADSRLIARVQMHAGGRCHEAANLLQSYTFGIDAYSRLTEGGRIDLAREIHESVAEAEANLRRFLCRRRST